MALTAPTRGVAHRGRACPQGPGGDPSLLPGVDSPSHTEMWAVARFFGLEKVLKPSASKLIRSTRRRKTARERLR
jgi:hypothetical protein